MKKKIQNQQHAISFHERTLVTAVRHALPYVVGIGLAMSIIQTADSRSSDSAAAFTATQLVRQFTLKNTVTQVSLGMQGYVADVGGQQRGPAMGPRPTGFPVDMGSVPNTVNLPQRDGAGRPLGYCAWDNTTLTASADYNAGQGVANPLVYAVVSPGLNGSMQTTCAYILQNGAGQGDDHVQVATPIQVSSKQYKTAVGTEADLLTTPGEEGDIRLVLDTNKLYSYVNGGWTGVQASPFSDNSAVNGAGAIAYTGGTVTVADFQATTAAITGAVTADNATFTNGVVASTFTGNGAGLTDLNAANFSGGVVSPEFGGTGVNGAAAANGTLLIGNGSGYTLGTLTAGAGVSVLNDAGAITIANNGVISITGTADQIVANVSNGDVVLSLPQSIATTSTPTFGGMMLNGNLTGTDATFTGAVNVGSLVAQRLDVMTSAGVTNPNMIVGAGAMAGVQSGNGGNSAIGILALNSNTSGQLNTATGLEALSLNTTGSFNTGNGFQALYSNGTGYSNSAFGVNSMLNNTTGFSNTAVGGSSGAGNTTGSNNTFLGASADASSGALTYATALGAGSRVSTSNTIALGRTTDTTVIGATGTDGSAYRLQVTGGVKAISGGFNANNGTAAAPAYTFAGQTSTGLYLPAANELAASIGGTRSMFIGHTVVSMGIGAGGSGPLGYGTVAVGQSALFNNTGAYNTAVGIDAMASNTTGNQNTALGSEALVNNITGGLNVAVGAFAMEGNTSGSANSAVGEHALRSNTTGGGNSVLGIYVMSSNTTGSNNTAVGDGAGSGNTTGSLNTFLGADANVETGALEYATALGAGSRVSTSNTIALGRVGDFTVIGATGTATSGILQNKNLQVTGSVGISGNLAIGGDFAANTFSGASATFTGAVNALRLNVNDPTGVTFGNLAIGLNNLAGAQSGTGANIAIGSNALNGNTTGAYNVAIGYDAQQFNTIGNDNTSVGAQTLRNNTAGFSNAALGAFALRDNNTGYENAALGAHTLVNNTTGSFNSAVGAFALNLNTTGDSNTAVGQDALRSNTTGPENTALGRYALRQNTTGGDNVATGVYALLENTSGYSNVGIGRGALVGNTTGSNNVALGRLAGNTNITGGNNTFLGYYADATTGALSYATAIGSNSLVATNNTIALGRNSNEDQIVIGTNARNDTFAGTKLYVNGATNLNGDLRGTTATFSGAVVANGGLTVNGAFSAQRLNVEDLTGVTFGNLVIGRDALAGPQTGSGANIAIGFNALNANTSGAGNTAVGFNSQRLNTTGSFNVSLGSNSLFSNTTGYNNTALGVETLRNNTTGFFNVAVGTNALRDNTVSRNTAVGEGAMTFTTSGGANSALGAGALHLNTTGYNNSAVGDDALGSNTTGFNNTALGRFSGTTNATGSDNTFLGFDADATSSALTFATAIGANSRVATNNTIALGRNSNVDQIVIGTDTRNNTTANTKLYVNGDTRLNGTLYGTTANFSGAVTMGALAVERLNIATSAGGVTNSNVIIGTGAMVGPQSGTGGNTAVGIGSLASNTNGFYNTATGNYSLFSNTTGYKNTVMGDGGMYFNTTGYYNTAMGDAALVFNTQGYENAAIGNAALYANTTGNRNTANGVNALSANTTGSNNIALGYNSGNANTTGSNNTFLGNQSNATNGALTYATAVGSNSTVATSNTIALGRNSNLDQVVIGAASRNDTTANTKLYVSGATFLNGDVNISGVLSVNGSPVGSANKTGIDSALTFGTGNLTLGTNSLQLNSGGARNTALGQNSLTGGVNLSGTDNTALGFGTLQALSNDNGFNVAIGAYALNAGPNINRNVAIGYEASRFNASNDNVAIGSGAARNNTSGSRNLAIGTQASFFNGSQNDVVAIGYQAAHGVVNFTAGNIVALGNYALRNLSSGSNSVAIGNEALRATTTGANNVALGRSAGDTNTTGNSNTLIGNDSDVSSGGLSFAAAFGAESRVATSNTIALGRNSTLDQIVIGTDTRNNTTANTKLYVNGDTRLNGTLYGTTANFSGAVTMGSLSLARVDVSTSAGGVTFPNMIVGTGAMAGAQSGAGKNTALGINALAVNTSGARNTATGYGSLSNNTIGNSNSSYGEDALTANTTGNFNSAFGEDTLLSNTSGVSNSAFGGSALGFTSTGNDNVGVGRFAGDTNSTGSNNTFIGYDSDATTGALTYAAAFGSGSRVGTSNTIALGRNSTLDQIVIGTDTRNNTTANTKLYVNGDTRLNGTLYGTNATFSGTVTMNSLALQRLDVASSAGGVGSPNIIVGLGAMAGAQSGNGGNTAVGQNTLNANTTGWNNVGVGRSALQSNTTGDRNISIGALSSFSNTTGNYNVVMGDEALFSNTGGISNTAIGIKALRQSTGNYNTAIGEVSGDANTTGSNNTFLGSAADASVGGLSYATAIGSGSRVATSNTVVLGHTSDTTVIGATGTNGRGSKLQVTGTIEANLPADGVGLALVRDVYAPGGYVDITGAGYPGYSNSAPATIRFLDDNTQSSHIAFRTKNTGNLNNPDAERMRLTSTGNLLVGTASDNGDRLQVAGNIMLANSGSGSTPADVIRFGSGNEGTDPIYLGRINPSINNSILQLTLGDDPGATFGGNGDRFQIATTDGSVRHTFDSNGDAFHAGRLTAGAIAVSRLDLQSTAGVTDPNVVIGVGAMPLAQSGMGGNTVYGPQAMAVNSSGYRNVAIGHLALANNSSGYENIAMAGNALLKNTTGYRNVSIGQNTLLENTVGYENMALGLNTLYSNTSGNRNVGVGPDSMYFNTTGYQNVAIGRSALDTNTTGYKNTAIGHGADVTIGNLNYAAAIGADAEVATSNTMVLGRSGGADQVVVGSSSRSDDYANTKLRVGGNILGSSLVVDSSIAAGVQGAYLQWNRDSGSGATYLVNQRGLGGGGLSFGESSGSNVYTQNMFLSSGGNLSVVGAVSATAFNVSSDRRLKTNINQLDTGNVLDKLEALRTYSYDYIANRDLGRRIGVIAQELQPLFPEAVAVRSDGFMAVDYNALGAMAAVGVGQLSSKFKVLDNRVTEQGELITALDEKVSGVDTRVASLETWKTEAVGRMDGFQVAIDSNVKKIAENALAIQGNTTEIKRLDDVLIALDGTVKGNSESIKNINARWGNTFSASEDGSLLTVLATELKVSNFTADKMRSGSVYTQRLEAEMAAIRELEVDSLKANTAVANSVQAKMVNTGAAQVYAGVGAPAFLFSAPSDGHYTVNTSAMDGSYATATVIVNAGQAKIVPIASEGIELMAIGNTVKANAAGKSIKASWIKTG